MAGRVRRRFAEGMVRPSGAEAAEPLLRLVVRDSLIAVLDESDPDQIRELGELLGVSVPEEIEDWEPTLEAFIQAVEGKRALPDLVGVLFALRLLDYEGRGQRESGWQVDEGLRRYVSFLIELGYEASNIERELLDTWTAEAEDGAAATGPLPADGSEEVAVSS